MASTFSTNLALELIGTGDQAGTWGVTTNTNLGTLVEQAISGYVTQAVSTGADTTITIPNGATGVARNMYIELTGTGGTNTNLIVPSNKKLYFIFNNTSSGQVTVKVSGQTGVSVPNGKKVVLVCNGTDIVNGLNYIADFGTNSFTVTNLTASSGTITNLIATTASVSDASATVLRASSATLTHLSATSASITNLALTSLTISSLSITNVSVASATVSSNLTLSGGTANGVAYLNGSKVLTTGSALTFDGTGAFSLANTGNVISTIQSTSTSATRSATLRLNVASTGGDDPAGTVSFTYGAGFTQAAAIDVTHTNPAMKFVIGSTEKMRLTSSVLSTDSSISVGIGTASPTQKLTVAGNILSLSAAGTDGYVNAATNGVQNTYLGFNNSGSTNAAGALNNHSYVGSGNSYGVQILSNGAAVATFTNTYNVGIGTASPGYRLQVDGASTAGFVTPIVAKNPSTNAASAAKIGFDGGGTIWGEIGVSYNTNDPYMAFFVRANSEKMRLTDAGNLGIGTTSPSLASGMGIAVYNSTVGGAARIALKNGSTGDGSGDGFQLVASGVDAYIEQRENGFLAFTTNNTERARITSGGALLVGTTNADPVSSDVVGVSLGDIDGLGRFSRDGGDALQVNRKTSDGNLVRFFQAGAEEGSISVSGNTVSYNAFAGSHWSQLQDGSRPDILRGTVMESINELCVWPGESNERLPKSKISDTAGSKKVYGVFMAWDNDWTETNDMYVTAVGAFICRVNGSVTVQEGDLLESNGDGTARVQADDIIRSSTIGKVTSTVKTHEYDDGSYCVPTVLYCG